MTNQYGHVFFKKCPAEQTAVAAPVIRDAIDHAWVQPPGSTCPLFLIYHSFI